jgi:7-keto-8-aminopelargonate synthetase-like enzyme
MDLGDLDWGGVDYIGLAQDRDKWQALVNAVKNLRIPQTGGKLLRGYTTDGLFVSAQLHLVSCTFC